MTRRRWTTAEQRTFLESKLPDYVQLVAHKRSVARSKHSSDRPTTEFFQRLSGEWFGKWPERETLIEAGHLPPEASETNSENFTWSPEQRELYKKAITTRKERLKRWMRNHTSKATGEHALQQNAQTVLAAMFKPLKRRRPRRDEELYQVHFREKINALTQVELEKLPKEGMDELHDPSDSPSDSDADDSSGSGSEDDVGRGEEGGPSQERPRHGGKHTASKSRIMAVRRKVVKMAWENESSEVKEMIVDKVREEKEEFTNLASMGNVVEPSPMQRQFMIENLVTLLHATCAEIHRVSGWSTMAMSGGPNPAAGGKITMQTVTYGKTATGVDFPSSYTQFEDAVSKPYVSWLKRVYPKEERLAIVAAVQDNELISMDKESEDGGTVTGHGACSEDTVVMQGMSAISCSAARTELPAPDVPGGFARQNSSNAGVHANPFHTRPLSPMIPIDPVLLADTVPANDLVEVSSQGPSLSVSDRSHPMPGPLPSGSHEAAQADMTECGGFLFPSAPSVPSPLPLPGPLANPSGASHPSLLVGPIPLPEIPIHPTLINKSSAPPEPAMAIDSAVGEHYVGPLQEERLDLPPIPTPSDPLPTSPTCPETRPAIKPPTQTRSKRKVPVRKESSVRQKKTKVTPLSANNTSNAESSDADGNETPSKADGDVTQSRSTNTIAEEMNGKTPAKHAKRTSARNVPKDPPSLTLAEGRTRRAPAKKKNVDGTEVVLPVKGTLAASAGRKRSAAGPLQSDVRKRPRKT